MNQQNEQYTQQEDFSFFDFDDQTKVKCYFPNKDRRPSMMLPKTQWATTKEEKQNLLTNLIRDINISTEDIKITPSSIKLLNSKYYVKPSVNQFVEQKIQVFDQNHNELTPDQITQMAALGQLSVSGFKKNKVQKSQDQYAREIDIEKLDQQRELKGIPKVVEPLPRLFLYRQKSQQRDDEYRKQKMVENLENFIPIGKFNENSTIYATCLPSSKKDREQCELLKIDIQKESSEQDDDKKYNPMLQQIVQNQRYGIIIL